MVDEQRLQNSIPIKKNVLRNQKKKLWTERIFALRITLFQVGTLENRLETQQHVRQCAL